MRPMLRMAVLMAGLALMVALDVVPPGLLSGRLVPDAHAILGVRRRSFATGVIVGEAAGKEAAASHQQAAAAPPPAAPAAPPPPAPAAAPPPPPPAAPTGPVPLGTVVPALPSGCTSTPVGGIEYYYCGGNFNRAVFQGNQLVYVTAKP
jgi:hypothetical protein